MCIRDSVYIVANRCEQALRREGNERGGVAGIDVAKVERLATGIGRGCADLESRTRRRQHHTAGRIGIEEIRRQIVRRGGPGRNTVPIDFAADAAERSVRASYGAAAEVGTEQIARGRKRRRIGAGAGAHGQLRVRLPGEGERESEGEQARRWHFHYYSLRPTIYAPVARASRRLSQSHATC